MLVSILTCLISLLVAIVWLRENGTSLGIPIAYLFTLLFIHVPGATAHLVGEEYLSDTAATEIGIKYTAIATVSFLLGVIFVGGKPRYYHSPGPVCPDVDESRKFAIFCLAAGLLVTYTLRLVIRIPSIGAIVEKSGGIWVLGVIFGLQLAVYRGNIHQIGLWLLAMGVYPVITLLYGGFLSFGSTPIIIVLSSLVISIRSHLRVITGVPLISLIFFSLFLSYFQNRDNIRGAVWGGADLNTRWHESLSIITEIQVFNPDNLNHLEALDRRLNQNFFVGRSAQRIESGQVGYIEGRSIWEGVLSLVPRILWPSKPVYAGSPGIIMEMTGFVVNESTSYGVGNVMELYISYGISSLVIGFFLLGGLFRWLDHGAARCGQAGDYGGMVLYFLPAAAMIHPNGSLVELFSGGAAALLAGYGWRWLWNQTTH